MITWGVYHVVWLVQILWKILMLLSVSWYHTPHHNINQEENVIFLCLYGLMCVRVCVAVVCIGMSVQTEISIWA